MSGKQRRGGYLATAAGAKKLADAKDGKGITFSAIAEAVQETEDKVKRLFNPQWGNGKYRVGRDAVIAICKFFDLQPAEIVSDWYIYKINISDKYSNRSTDIPSETTQLNSITSFDYSSRRLTRFPVKISKITSLTHLYLHYNHLTNLAIEIGELTNLTHLYLHSNYLSKLPAEIGNLTNLTHLYIGNNALTILPKEIGELVNLKKIDIRDNNLRELPAEIGNLTKLTHLYIGNNNLRELPVEIGKLINLEEIDVRDNNLRKLPAEIGKLINLKRLCLIKNNLTTLPLEIGQLINIEAIFLKGNNLNNLPPELLNDSSVIGYYSSLQNNQQKPLHEAKMLLVGQGNVGKTCLRERLIRDVYDPTRNKTDGIDIEGWDIKVDQKELQVNIWDFGGQEIMPAILILTLGVHFSPFTENFIAAYND